MKKTRWMWVHYGTEPVKAKVFWSRNGLAVTQVDDEEFSLTHVKTGNRIGPSLIGQLPLAEVLKVARVLAPLYQWKTLSFHNIVTRAATMKRRCEKALRKAGLTKARA